MPEDVGDINALISVNRLVSRDVTLLHRESATFRWRAGSEIAEDLPVPSEKMTMFYVVYGCTNRSNREKGKGFYRVPKIVTHKGIDGVSHFCLGGHLPVDHEL